MFDLHALGSLPSLSLLGFSLLLPDLPLCQRLLSRFQSLLELHDLGSQVVPGLGRSASLIITSGSAQPMSPHFSGPGPGKRPKFGSSSLLHGLVKAQQPDLAQMHDPGPWPFVLTTG